MAAKMDETSIRAQARKRISPFSGEIHTTALAVGMPWLPRLEVRGTIHKNASISTTNNFHCLRNYFTGDPAAMVAGLPTTESCYSDAITMLKTIRGQEKNRAAPSVGIKRRLPRVKAVNDFHGLR